MIDPRETIRAVLADLHAGVATATVASRFHAAISAATVDALVRAASSQGVELIVLSGGVFQNRRLLESAADGLGAAGLRVITPERLPVGDGGISFGQAAIAARRTVSSREGRGVAEVTGLNAERERLVASSVFIRGADRPFGELTLEDVRVRADELRSVIGWGPTVRVAPVARAWRELAIEMERCGAACVSELDAEIVVELAPRLWVTVPGGSLMS